MALEQTEIVEGGVYRLTLTANTVTVNRIRRRGRGATVYVTSPWGDEEMPLAIFARLVSGRVNTAPT